MVSRHQEEIAIVKGGAERIPELQPLWESLDQHHAEVAPELDRLGPVRTPAESWVVRRGLYEVWLVEPDAFVLLAEAGARAVGYARVHMRGPEETWATGDRVAELETLTVLPSHRNRGIGTMFMEAVYRELRKIDVSELFVSVIASNTDALRFYERHDLSRFLISYIGPVPRP